MTRLIDADELLKDNTWEWFDEWGNYTIAGQAIADAPTVDAVEVVHGEWEISRVDPTTNYIQRFRCTVCNQDSRSDYDYCPNCGAKMDGGDKE